MLWRIKVYFVRDGDIEGFLVGYFYGFIWVLDNYFSSGKFGL